MLVLLSHEVLKPLITYIERPAVECGKVVELDDEGNGAHLSATSADAVLSLDECLPLVCRAEAPRIGSVHSSSVKKRKP